MKKTMKEFKEFISRGNVIDLAVGVIIGAAFGKIVTSLVNDVLMPLIGILFGGLDLTNLTFKLKDASINYGTFLQNVIDFLARLVRDQEAASSSLATPTTSEAHPSATAFGVGERSGLNCHLGTECPNVVVPRSG